MGVIDTSQDKTATKGGRPRLFSERLRFLGLKLEQPMIARLKKTARSRHLSVSALVRELLDDTCKGCQGHHRKDCPTQAGST